MTIYLDHAATTPLLPQALAAMQEGFRIWANPSSPHKAGRAARAALEDARARLKVALGWTGEVIFTSGASEAIALATSAGRHERVLTSAVEHDAVLRTTPGAVRLPVGADGLLDFALLDEALGEGPALVAVQQVNSETGVVQDVARVAKAVKARGGTILVDAAQGVGKLPLPPADMIALSAHKFGGPIGIGALLVRDYALLCPTGGQERGYRPGTEPLPLVLGMAAALEAGNAWLKSASGLRESLASQLLEIGAEVVALAAPRLPTIGAYRMPGKSSAAQLIRFDGAGIAVSAGSACSSGSLKASHVLTAMGIEGAGEVIRVSIGRETTEADIARFIEVWREIRGVIYLDYQATTPLAPEAREAMIPWLAGPEEPGFANPHSPHRYGRAAAAAVEVGRAQVAALFPAGGRVVFTSGATEALNLAIIGSGRKRLAVSAIEHAAVLDTARFVDPDVAVLPVSAAGLVDADVAIPDGTGLVAVMQVNNEIGTVQPVEALAQRARAMGALFLCDAVQGAGKLTAPAGADLIAASSHKLYGPKGIGALWVRDGVELQPLIHGGGQEGGLRSGTLSSALCAGFGAAAALCTSLGTSNAEHVERLWTLARALFADWTLNGSADARWQGNLNVRLDGLDVARLLSECRNVAFSAGSACASGSGRPSHVLRALGLSDRDSKTAIRLGFGRYTREDDLIEAAAAIHAAARSQGVL